MNVEHIVSLLKNRNESISTAESCTGGGLANAITLVPGVSRLFMGGVICYDNVAKINVLSISHDEIKREGAVSESVARSMAENARKLFNSTWAIATTGIAGPTGGSDDKPIGTVWIAIAGPHALVRKFIFSNVSREEHRHHTIAAAVAMLNEACAH